MTDKQKLLKFLDVISKRLEHHDDVLWEEEKHYTWWIYIIFVGIVSLYITQNFSQNQKLILITLGCFFGVAMSLIGYNVIRKEGGYAWEAIGLYKRALKDLDFPEYMIYPTKRDKGRFKKHVENKNFGSIISKANKPLNKLMSNTLKSNLGIRDFFQLTFIITTFIFIVFFIFSLITLLNLI